MEALDILAADVDDKVHLGLELLGRGKVGHGLHQRGVEAERAADHILTVAGGSSPGNGHIGEFPVDRLQKVLDQGHGVAAVGEIGGIENLLVLPHQHGLDGGGTGVHAQIGLAAVAGVLDGFHPVGVVAGFEFLVLLLIGKEGLAGLVIVAGHRRVQCGGQLLQIHTGIGQLRRTTGHKVQGVVRTDALQAQNPVKAVAQLR